MTLATSQRPRLAAAILTATVRPQFAVAHSNSEQRLAEYASAVSSWLAEEAVGRVILVENSGVDAKELINSIDQRLRGRLMALSAPPPTEEHLRRGKGAAEAAMLEFALTQSDLPPGVPFAKVTGRFRSRNLNLCLRDLPVNGFVRARLKADLTQMDTRFFITDRETFESVFWGAGNEVDEAAGRWLEHACAARLLVALAGGHTALSRFPSSPALYGVSGTTGQQHSGVRWAARQTVEELGRRISRNNGLWI